MSLLLIIRRKNGLQNLSVGERALRMIKGLAAQKMPSLIVHNLVMCDRRRDLRRIASKVDISFGAVQTILTDILGMSKLSARWIPRMLTDDQKRSRLDISRYLQSRYEENPGDFIDRVVTQDETWVHHFDPGRKCKACNGSILAHTLPKSIREFLRQGR